MTYQSITSRSSPNHSGARTKRVTSITIHHWGAPGQSFDGVVSYLCRPAGTSSAHYVVEDGRVACIVDPDQIAWHAGVRARNEDSIGIECRPEATDGDYATVAELVRELRAAYGDLPLKHHRDWKATACPGIWDLKRLDALARAGAPSRPASSTTTRPTVQPARAPLPTVQEDDTMIVILNKSNNAAIIVSGGRSAPVVGWDQYTALTQTLPSVGVSAAQFNAIATAFPNGAA